jgi:hypothetical protein
MTRLKFGKVQNIVGGTNNPLIIILTLEGETIKLLYSNRRIISHHKSTVEFGNKPRANSGGKKRDTILLPNVGDRLVTDGVAWNYTDHFEKISREISERSANW